MALASTLRCTSPSGIEPTRFAQHLIDGAVIRQLVAHAHGVGERNHHLLFDLAVEGGVVLLLRDVALRLAGVLGQRVDGLDDALDGGVAGLEPCTTSSSVTSLAPASTITMAVFAARHHEVERLFLRCS